MTNKIINLIVAHDTKNGISKLGVIPWTLKKDMDFFRLTTTDVTNKNMANALIMGSSTFKSFKSQNQSLNRKLFVVTRQKIFDDIPNITVVPSVELAIDLANKTSSVEKIFAASNIAYKYVIENDLVDKMLVTKINNDYQCDNHIFDYSSINFGSKSIIYTDDRMEISEMFNNRIVSNPEEQVYLDFVKEIIEYGEKRSTRNAHTLSVFGKSLVFNLEQSFPLLTTKSVYFKGIIAELIDLFLKGNTDSTILTNQKVKIWQANTSREFLDSRNLHNYTIGTMGPMYGYQWRCYGQDYKTSQGSFVDQLKNVIDLIINDHTSRRIMMTTYNPKDSDKCVLDPCHGLITQFYVRNCNDRYYLDCQTYQRSADVFLGLPFNIGSYALLVNILCTLCRPNRNIILCPGKLTIHLGDAHIYNSHVDLALGQTLRRPLKFPTLTVDNDFITIIDNIYENNASVVDDLISLIDDGPMSPSCFKVNNYVKYHKITAPMIP